jgi:hypothetical protein
MDEREMKAFELEMMLFRDQKRKKRVPSYERKIQELIWNLRQNSHTYTPPLRIDDTASAA